MLLATIAPAAACSVRPGYRVPSTLELVKQADAIVLAKVEDGPAIGTEATNAQLTLAPVLAIKGALPDRLRMPGWIAAGDVTATPSDPDELQHANPDAYTGACNRYVFAQGMTLLLFVKRDGKGWGVMSPPFARTAEDVTAFDARWVKAVREYVQIAALPPAMQRARLAARRDVLRTQRDADSLAIAEDLERELAGPRKPLRSDLPAVPD